MGKNRRTAINPTRNENYPEWYQKVIQSADLAENSGVRGCMVIKPWGFGIWENIKNELDRQFKATDHKNAYFPLFIPKSYFEKEAEHVEGFAKECAVVTHSRLENDGKGGLKVAGELTEQLIVRPTSETIIGESFSKWINSYRDLPLKINQWANVVRWEMRPRLFLRTAEFLWQEGHTAHSTKEEAQEETKQMLDIYADFAEKVMALPVIKGRKSEAEKFPGADETLCIEAMMQDGKALQAGTSHFLGQNFAKASDIKFQNDKEEMEYAWTTSWGVSTRLIGALIMAHSDDDGLVLPPKIAPSHIAIIPIFKNKEQEKEVLDFVYEMKKDLEQIEYFNGNLNVEIDNSTASFGTKSWNWVKKGIPIRLEVGPRDIKNNSVFMGRRDKDAKDKQSMKKDEFSANVVTILDEIQENIYQKALSYREENSRDIKDRKKFYKFFKNKKGLLKGGFAKSHWCGSSECEEKIKEDLKVTIRAIPFNSEEEEGYCISCNKKTNQRVIFSKSY